MKTKHDKARYASQAISKIVPSSSQEEVFGRLLRRAIDEVVDTPRSSRRFYSELSKVEKTYIGTKIELLIQDLLECDRGKVCDLLLGGVECDVKSSQKTCMFPTEAVDQLCLIVLHNEIKKEFDLGLWLCNERGLNPGKNKDQKRTISKIGKQEVLWLVEKGKIPDSFFASISQEEFDQLQDLSSINQLTALCKIAVKFNDGLLPLEAAQGIKMDLELFYKHLNLVKDFSVTKLSAQTWFVQNV